MREFVDKLVGRLLIGAAFLAAASLIAQYGFFMPASYLQYLFKVDVLIIILFVSENFIRLALARDRRGYLKAHWLDFTLIGLFGVQIISLRFFSESRIVAAFLAKLDIRSLTKAYIIAAQIYIGSVLFIKTVDANRVIAKLRLTAPQLVLLTFASAIGIGTLLLLLPRATATGQSMPIVDALFTATSATCVTGLIVVDTGSYFSGFGQGIILFLIQLGGIGIMSLVAFSATVMGRGIGVRQRALLKDVLSSDFFGEVTPLIRNIILITMSCEAVGVLILSRVWASDFVSPLTTFYYALFHSVSAFCNAGFSLFDDSLVRFSRRPDVVFTFAGLIIIGGLGFMVISNLASAGYRRIRGDRVGSRLTLHTRIVLVMSLTLLVLGAVAVLFLEAGGSPLGEREQLLTAFFTSVTARTAGFSTISMASLSAPTALVVILLMFIGASPGGTGGGTKTSTIAVLLATIRSILRGRPNVELFKRTIPTDIVNKAICVVLLSLGLIFLSSVAISALEHQPLTEVLFECVSAFGTVGLSRGLTQHLTIASKLIIITTMFFGRIGPLTLGLAIGQRSRETAYAYPSERVVIG